MNPHAVTVHFDSQKPFDTGRNNQIKKKNKEKDKGANQFIIILKCRLSVQDLHQGFGHLFHISMLKRWFGVDGLLVVASLFTLQLQLHPLGSWCNLSNKFSNSRRSRITKKIIFWPWWQPFDSFCFESLSFLPLPPFFLFAMQKSVDRHTHIFHPYTQSIYQYTRIEKNVSVYLLSERLGDPEMTQKIFGNSLNVIILLSAHVSFWNYIWNLVVPFFLMNLWT